MHRYAFFDLDQTIYKGYSCSELVFFLADNGICDKRISVRLKDMQDAYDRGEVSYKRISDDILQLFANVISGMSVKDLDKWTLQFLGTREIFFDYVPKIFNFLKKESFTIYIISGSPQPIIKIIGKILGADKPFGTTIAQKNGKYQPKITHLLNFETKAELVHRVLAHIPENSIKIGFGDSTGDVDMLLHCQNAFIINPHEARMYKIAKENKWTVTQNADVMLRKMKKIIG